MLASEIRANARRALSGKWGKGALITLCYVLIMWVINLILGLIPVIGQIATLVISAPISYGILVSFMKLKRGEEVSCTEFLNNGFSNFKRVWGVYGHTLLKMIVPIIVLVVMLLLVTFSSVGILVFNSASGDYATRGLSLFSVLATIVYVIVVIWCAIKGLLYSLTNYILFDNPNMTSKEIVEESERLMKGNRGKYIWLELTFIGWMILSAFTLYIGLFWLVPYITVSIICFYEALSDKEFKQEVIKEENYNPISE